MNIFINLSADRFIKIFIYGEQFYYTGGVCLLPCHSGVPGHSDEKVTVGDSFFIPDNPDF